MNDIHTPGSASLPGFARHAGRDEQTAAAVRKTELIPGLLALCLMALCLLPVASNFFINWWRHGIGSGLGNGLVALLVMGVVFVVASAALQFLFVLPWCALRYRACMKRMAEALPGMGLTPTLLHQWSDPSPGLLALDAQQGLLYINASSNGYERLFLTPADILGAKVESESEIHTQTTHGGSVTMFSSAGLGYNFGSRSKSTSVTVENAFLEIHYQQPGMAAPAWVALPFGENRRDAESMLMAIQRLGQPPRA